MLFPLFGLLIAGPALRVLLYLQLVIWTSASTCEWISSILDKSPNFPILCGLTPIIDLYKGNWLDLLKVKNHIEVLTMIISVFGWVFSLNAPLLPVVYTQFVRIKAISSHFTQNSFSQLNKVLKGSLPDGIYLAFVAPVINYLSKPENEGSDGAPGAKEKVGEKKTKKQQVQEDSSSEEEPRTYEIHETSVPEATAEDLD